MTEASRLTNGFVGYEYHSITAPHEMESVYIDGYENFGWIQEPLAASLAGSGLVEIKFKRDRKIRNKAELTRLQRQFEACVNEIIEMDKSKNALAAITAYTIGILGCAFLGGATFSYRAGMLPLMVILSIPGFTGWILPYFCYRRILKKRGEKMAPLIEKKHDEIYDVCEKANHLLTQ